jgi:2-oxo-4-hydroxy-4-carboxy-5-ureidoimidazoline decarboxylase
MSADELARFQQLNAAYRERFGFPFIICARLNARDAILRSMQQRIDHSAEEEHATALAEIEKIAWLRLEDLLRQP